MHEALPIRLVNRGQPTVTTQLSGSAGRPTRLVPLGSVDRAVDRQASLPGAVDRWLNGQKYDLWMVDWLIGAELALGNVCFMKSMKKLVCANVPSILPLYIGSTGRIHMDGRR